MVGAIEILPLGKHGWSGTASNPNGLEVGDGEFRNRSAEVGDPTRDEVLLDDSAQRPDGEPSLVMPGGLAGPSPLADGDRVPQIVELRFAGVVCEGTPD